MMNKILCTIILFSFFSLSFAQKSAQLDKYYNHLYKAEDFIVVNDFDSATYYYEAAFNMFSEHFIADLNNALISAIESDRYDLTDKYLLQLLSQGVPKSYFEKKYYYTQFVGTGVFTALDEVLDIKLDSVRIKLIDSLLILDQFPRVNNLLDSILIVDESNEKILVTQIFEDGLIPRPSKIGVEIFNDTLILPSNLDVLIIHQIRNNPEKYREFYKKNLEQRRISPIQYFSKSNLFTERTPEELLGCEERMFAVIQFIEDDGFTCCCDLKNRVDLNRKKYYLENIDRAIRKYQFGKKSALPFIIEKGLVFKSNYYDVNKSEEAKNKLKADPSFVRYEDN